MKKNQIPTNVKERQYITQEELSKIENDVIRHEHIKRYASVRRFCYGKVLDCACGAGYGSNLLGVNDDVISVTGIDIDSGAIAWAKKEFKNKKLNFKCQSADTIKGKFDTLVCIETIEHIKDKNVIPNLVERCKIDNVMISFPDKKTTHYNKHHAHDFIRQDIVDLFPNHTVYHTIKFFDSLTVLLTRRAKSPHYLFRNLKDL